MTDHAQQFAEIVGAAAVSRAASGIVVVSPATTEEVSSTLRYCSQHGIVVCPRGGGTKAAWGNPVNAGLVLSTQRLTGIVEHVWQDMTATVRAGTTWAAMQSGFATHGQQAALDPLFADRATLGGVLATNDSGAMRVTYGSSRDITLGITIVLADGTIARSGGKVVKNVAGYDLPKLLVGSFGTLGIITEASLRLHPLPRGTHSWTLRSPDAQALDASRRALLSGALNVERLQLRTEMEAFALDVAATQDALPEAFADASPASETVWHARDNLFANPTNTVLKITSLPERVPVLLAGFAQLNTAGACGAACVAHVPGITWAALRGEPATVATIVEDLRARLRATGGMVVIHQAGALDESTLDRWGGSPAAIDVMRAIKREFDPNNILNPGTFVGGI